MYNTTTTHGPDTTDPRLIDWPERQARAVIPFRVSGGLPINPMRPDLAAGRGDLWHWGEATAADALVIAMDSTGYQRLLMVRRGDGLGWAMPGGGLDKGETPLEAGIRELTEETGLELPATVFDGLGGRYADDPRAGRNAWMVTFPLLASFITETPPPVFGRDDADAAEWLPANNYAELSTAIRSRGDIVFKAHREILRELLN